MGQTRCLQTEIHNCLGYGACKQASQKKSNKGNNTGKPKGGGGSNHPDLPSWRVKRSGPKFTCPNGDKQVWCKHHGRKDKHGNQRRMHMPEGHKDESWVVTRAAKHAAFKLDMREFKAAKLSGPEIKNTGQKLKSDGGKKNLSLAKSFARALTTKSQMSDTEAADIINSVMKKYIDDDDNNDSSKYQVRNSQVVDYLINLTYVSFPSSTCSE